MQPHFIPEPSSWIGSLARSLIPYCRQCAALHDLLHRNVPQGSLDFKGPLILGTFEQTKQWVDPIVGLKLKKNLTSKWHFSIEGDIGGFGAGSDFAWRL